MKKSELKIGMLVKIIDSSKLSATASYYANATPNAPYVVWKIADKISVKTLIEFGTVFYVRPSNLEPYPLIDETLYYIDDAVSNFNIAEKKIIAEYEIHYSDC